jgi:hypothetical protein
MRIHSVGEGLWGRADGGRGGGELFEQVEGVGEGRFSAERAFRKDPCWTRHVWVAGAGWLSGDVDKELVCGDAPFIRVRGVWAGFASFAVGIGNANGFACRMANGCIANGEKKRVHDNS